MPDFTFNVKGSDLQIAFPKGTTLPRLFIDAMTVLGWRYEPEDDAFYRAGKTQVDPTEVHLSVQNQWLLAAGIPALPAYDLNIVHEACEIRFSPDDELPAEFIQLAVQNGWVYFAQAKTLRRKITADYHEGTIRRSLADLWSKTPRDAVQSDGDFGPVIYGYSRAQAIEDGILADASTGELGALSKEHYRWPIAMTVSVWSLISQALRNPQAGNDLAGVWHDILYMCKRNGKDNGLHERLFEVILRGADPDKPLDEDHYNPDDHTYTLKMVSGPGDFGEPVLTLMLPDED